MTPQQKTKLDYLLVDLALVLDRVYYDHKKKRILFRATWHWSNEHQRPIFGSGPHRLYISRTGAIVNRGNIFGD